MACQRYRLWLPYGSETVQQKAFITIAPAKFPNGGITLGVEKRETP